jgi:hypothetical protein
VDLHHDARHFGMLNIASGDHIFEPLARQARTEGMSVWNIAGPGARAKKWKPLPSVITVEIQCAHCPSEEVTGVSELSAVEAVHRAWRALPDAVLQSPLTSRPAFVPSDRTRRTLLPRILVKSPAGARSRNKSILINEPEAQMIGDEMAAAAKVLEDTVGWIQLLRLAAREARITGIDNEKYFVPAYDLALEHGYLGAKSEGRVLATEVFWREFLETREPSVDDVRRELSDPAFVTKLSGILDQEWVDGRRFPPDPEAADLSRLGRELLDLFGSQLEILDEPRAERLWGEISGHGAVDSWHDRANSLELTDADFPPRPSVLRAAGQDRALPLPLDRTIQDRVDGILGSGARERRIGLPPAKQMLLDETERSCKPLGLGTRRSRAIVVLGAYISHAFSLADARVADNWAKAAQQGQTRAAYTINRRLRRMSALYAAAIKGRLNGSLLNRLEDPAVPYLAKLWTRVRGREVRGQDLTDPHEVWLTLSNVASGVLNDIVGMQANYRPVSSSETVPDPTSHQRAEAPPSSNTGRHKFQFDEDARDRMMQVLPFAAGAVGQASLTRFMNDVVNDPDPQHQAALARQWDGWRNAVLEQLKGSSTTDVTPRGRTEDLPSYAEAAAFIRTHYELS